MSVTPDFRVNLVERRFIEKWASGKATFGESTPDGGLAVSSDGALIMNAAATAIRLAERTPSGILISNFDTSNPVLKEYHKALTSIQEAENTEGLILNLQEQVGQAANDSLRQLAKGNRPVLKHLITLHKAYRGDDPQLQSKEAKTAMQAILRIWGDEEPEAAHMFGQVNWEPDPITWMSFFDDVGSQPLGKALGLGSTQDIPEVPGSEYETQPEDIPEMPEYSVDDEEPESAAFDASNFLQ